MLNIHPDSHTDHIAHLTDAERDQLLAWLNARIDAFMRNPTEVCTITFDDCPFELVGSLRGPLAGDPPIRLDHQVAYRVRPGRCHASRMLKNAEPRTTRIITVVFGPHAGQDQVLFTVYGGPCAPREPGDESIDTWVEIQASRKFWGEHALAD